MTSVERKSESASRWSKPRSDRVHAILDRLREHYGVPTPKPHHDPVGELVLTVLSQNTNDRNRDVAFSRLIERWPSWEACRAAPVDEIERAIAPGGISKIKSARIKQILDRLANDAQPGRPEGHDKIDLDWMSEAPVEQSREYLCTLPGVARKTAACVLLFAYGLPDIPVDTHVGRVGKRLALFRPSASFEEMHDTMLEISPVNLAHETHVNLIRHGRRLCHSRTPDCGSCPLRAICPSSLV